jgi:transcriptional regulator with XRE-family HTH domain
MGDRAIRGDRVRALRQELQLTQAELAHAAPVSQSYLSEIESGKRVSVGTLVVLGLAHALHTSIDYLVGLTDDPKPTETLEGLTEEDWAILRGLSSLTGRDKRTVVDLIASLAARRSPH